MDWRERLHWIRLRYSWRWYDWVSLVGIVGIFVGVFTWQVLEVVNDPTVEGGRTWLMATLFGFVGGVGSATVVGFAAYFLFSVGKVLWQIVTGQGPPRRY